MGTTIAVIGLGRIGAFHAETLSGLAGVDELVVTDERPGVTAEVAERLGARAVPDSQAALAAGVDGVVIAAATPAHARLILAAVDAGIPVFCEKPIASTVAESRDLVSRLTGSTVPVQIGYNRRFDPAYVAAFEAVRSGELGRLTTVRSTTMDPAPPPAAYLAASGGIFRDCSVHDFDIVRWVVGREVVEVYATGSAYGEAMFVDCDDVATAQTLLTFDDGTLAVVSNTRYNGRGHDCRLELHGSVDTVVAGWDPSVPVRNLAPGVAFPPDAPHHFFMDRFAQAYRAELSAFRDVTMGLRASPCPPEEALEVAWIAEAATMSVHQHRPIRMDEVRS
jgi:myo-inositol 2-dehydrogenase/D-chiro-inositol 1-dehydrogenase